MYFVKEVKSSFSPYAYPKDTPLISINKARDSDITVLLENLEDKTTKEIIGFNKLAEFYIEQDCHVVGLYKKSPTEFKVELYDNKEAKVMQYLRFRFSRSMKSGLNYSYNFLHYAMSELRNGVVIDDHFSDDTLYIKPKEVRFHSSLEMLKFDFIDKQAFFRQLTKLMVLRKDEPIIKHDSKTVSYCQADVSTTYDLYQHIMQDIFSFNK